MGSGLPTGHRGEASISHMAFAPKGRVGTGAPSLGWLQLGPMWREIKLYFSLTSTRDGAGQQTTVAAPTEMAHPVRVTANSPR